MAGFVRTAQGLTADLEGYREFDRALKYLDAELAKEFKAAAKRAADIIAREAAARAPVGDPAKHRQKPYSPGKLRASIKAGVQAKGAYVQAGGARVPYIYIQEFGGSVPAPRSGKRIVVKPPHKGGYFLHPALGAKRQEALAQFMRDAEKILAEAEKLGRH